MEQKNTVKYPCFSLNFISLNFFLLWKLKSDFYQVYNIERYETMYYYCISNNIIHCSIFSFMTCIGYMLHVYVVKHIINVKISIYYINAENYHFKQLSKKE